MERRILTVDEWAMVEPVVVGDFGNSMPATADQATFFAETRRRELAAFVHIEHLLHFNCVYVAPQLRGTGLGLDLMRDAIARIPEGFSGIWMTDRSAGRLARRFKARELGQFTVYRKDA